MASVYEKANKWYLRWKGADGRWRDQVSTARSKTEARRLAGELERRAERQRLGLEPLPTDSSMTLGQLCEWWLRERCPRSSVYRERSRLSRHVLETGLGALPLTAVTAARIEERQREMERAGLARSYVNGLRRVLHTVFARARRDGLWSGPNPIDEVEKRPEPKRAYVTLRAEEVPLLLGAVPDAWRAVFAAALYTGLRKGELFGLRKSDVDLDHRTITVRRSYDRETTKGGQLCGVRSATEQTLTEIWARVLKLEQVGVNDNFFDLGGDSILAAQILARATRAGLPLTPRQLFKHQTVAELSALLDAKNGSPMNFAAARELNETRCDVPSLATVSLLGKVRRWLAVFSDAPFQV